MVSTDILVIASVIVLCVASFTWSTLYWRVGMRVRCKRTFREFVADIRAMNQYNSYFLGGILIFLGLIIENGKGELPSVAVVFVLAAFVCAAAAIFFIPVSRLSVDDASRIVAIRRLWLYTLVLSQWTIILVLFGIAYGVLSCL